MNKLKNAKRAQVVAALVEGNSIRATVRMTGVAKNTIVKLLGDLGRACSEYQDKALRNLPCKKLQVDEIWTFCYAKAKNVPEEKRGVFGYGDVWTFVAIDAETKLVPSWRIGPRSFETAMPCARDLAARLANRVQMPVPAKPITRSGRCRSPVPAMAITPERDDAAVSTRRCASPPRWLPASPIMSGRSRRSWGC